METTSLSSSSLSCLSRSPLVLRLGVSVGEFSYGVTTPYLPSLTRSFSRNSANRSIFFRSTTETMMLEGSNGVGDDEFSVCERMLFCCRCFEEVFVVDADDEEDGG